MWAKRSKAIAVRPPLRPRPSAAHVCLPTEPMLGPRSRRMRHSHSASQPASPPVKCGPKHVLCSPQKLNRSRCLFPPRVLVRPSGHNFLCSFCSLTPACFASIHARARSVVYSPPPPLSFPSFGREQIVKEGKNKVGAGNGMDRLRRTSLAGHSIGRLRRSFRRVWLPCLWAK